MSFSFHQTKRNMTAGLVLVSQVVAGGTLAASAATLDAKSAPWENRDSYHISYFSTFFLFA